jgi:hypothetical protein
MRKEHRTFRNVLAGGVGALILVSGTPALADGAGAFVGGMIAGRVLNNMKDRTQAEQQQAANSQQMVQQQQAAPAAPAQPTAQQRLDQLNKLAAGGYITPAEYKTKKKAIIDSM